MLPTEFPIGEQVRALGDRYDDALRRDLPGRVEDVLALAGWVSEQSTATRLLLEALLAEDHWLEVVDAVEYDPRVAQAFAAWFRAYGHSDVAQELLSRHPGPDEL